MTTAYEGNSSIPKHVVKVTTHDMHAGGEPLRIITSGLPDIKGSTIWEKREYVKQHLDHYRKLLINEPRGHKAMCGAILFQEKPNVFGVLFLNNEGYAPMCGHTVIALGRYIVDYGLVKPVAPETEITFNCTCGHIKAFVEYNNHSSGPVHFQSVTSFAYELGAEIFVPKIGKLLIDVAYGGAFYAVISDKDLSLDLKSTPLTEIIDVAGRITEAVKNQLCIVHPEKDEFSYLYGTIITDGKDKFEDGASTNICVFADKEVDRSACGSGVIARMALQWKKGFMQLDEEKVFKSITGSTLTGRINLEASDGNFSAVIVEVSGMAYHTGDHTFYLECHDEMKEGFQLPQ